MNRRDEIEVSLRRVREELPERVTLIVVTKTFPVSDIKFLYELGERDFGENRDVEGAAKSAELPTDVNWHFQGRIQSNKLRSILTWADYIHSLDDLAHARKIETSAAQLNENQPKVTPKIFIQINLDDPSGVARNPERSGIAPNELRTFAEEISHFQNFEVVGVMGVAPLGEDPAPSFERLAVLSQELQQIIPTARSISAGMSGDYRIALRFGATHIRLGSSILGSR